MQGLMQFVRRTNWLLFVAVVFLLHLALYLVLGTDRWLFATLSATVVYGAVFGLVKVMAANKNGGVR